MVQAAVGISRIFRSGGAVTMLNRTGFCRQHRLLLIGSASPNCHGSRNAQIFNMVVFRLYFTKVAADAGAQYSIWWVPSSWQIEEIPKAQFSDDKERGPKIPETGRTGIRSI